MTFQVTAAMAMAITEHTNATTTPIKLISSLLDNARSLIMHILTLKMRSKKTVMGGSHLRLEGTLRERHETLIKPGIRCFVPFAVLHIYSSDVKCQPFITHGLTA